MIDWTLNIPTIIAIVGALGWLFRMEGRGRENSRAIASLETKAIAKLEEDIEKLNSDLVMRHAEVALLKDALHAHKLHTAENFVTRHGLTEALNRMEKAIEGLSQRFDNFTVTRAPARQPSIPKAP